MKIIGSPTSPYVRKVRIVFSEKKVDVTLELENVWATDTKISATSPLGKVPCLLLDDGEAIYDSRVIVEYADTLSPVGKLIPAGSRERASVKTWEALADIAVGCALGYLLLRFPAIQWQAQHPNLDRLYQKLIQRASFIETAPPTA